MVLPIIWLLSIRIGNELWTIVHPPIGFDCICVGDFGWSVLVPVVRLCGGWIRDPGIRFQATRHNNTKNHATKGRQKSGGAFLSEYKEPDIITNQRTSDIGKPRLVRLVTVNCILVLLSLIPIIRHLIIGVIDLLVWDNGRSQVLEEVTLQEWSLVNDNVIRVVRMDHCTRRQNISHI